jgi:hypothetical protein
MQITLACLFGRGKENIQVPQRSCGVETQEHLGEVMQKIIEQTMTREFHMHLIFFPELFPIFWLTQYDRDLSYNID